MLTTAPWLLSRGLDSWVLTKGSYVTSAQHFLAVAGTQLDPQIGLSR